ncbi:MAG: DedA family protein [Deltaproteobacteria bacterium]|nr:DedA family protein [Deltaproteobacteria bacterium]
MINSDTFLALLHTLPKPLIYITLGLSAFIENIFPPIPGDTVMTFGAFLAAIGRLDLLGVYVSSTLGNLIGFMALFWLGGYVGRRFFIEKDFWFFKAENIIRAERWFIRYGYFIILINRFLPGARSVISIAGGISGLGTKKVMALCLASCAAWNLIWVFIGYSLGNKWSIVESEISSLLSRYSLTILVLFGVSSLFLIIIRCFRNKKRSKMVFRHYS